MEGEHGPTVSEVPSGPAGRLIQFLRSYLTLPRTHSIIGIIAGCLSISLGLYSYLHLAKPAAPVVGDLVAVVQDARTGKPVNDATVEILTLKEAVAILRRAVRVVLEQADPQLLIVRVVPHLGRGGGQFLHEGAAIMPGLQVGGGPVHRLARPQGEERLVELAEHLFLRHGVGALRGGDLVRAAVRHMPLVLGGAS